MKERPILFSGPMIRAILTGQKTVTRREIKKRAALDCLAAGFEPAFLTLSGNADLCPYGQPGDLLWVRESLGYDCEYGHYFAVGGVHGETIYLCSLFDDEDAQTGPSYDGLLPERSVPSIHLHRRYSRILLEITGVRVERLHDISEEQAEAESVGFLRAAPDFDETLTAKQLFEILWDHINGEGAWAANPWVWVVEFKRVTP